MVDGIKRRGFLRMLSAVAVSAAMPCPVFAFAESGLVVPNKPIELGSIRELVAYEINRDDYVIRLDALNGRTNEQIFVQANLSDLTGLRYQTKYEYAHPKLQKILREEIIKRGWRADDLVALPTPRGYQFPEFLING